MVTGLVVDALGPDEWRPLAMQDAFSYGVSHLLTILYSYDIRVVHGTVRGTI